VLAKLASFFLPRDLFPESRFVMTNPVIWFAFAIGIGFVISAIVTNAFGAITKSASPLTVPVKSDAERLAMVALLLLAGPHILVRAANKSRELGDWPDVYVWASYGLAGIWSFVVGFAVLSAFSF
jgi:hypothetical protein